MKRSYTRHVRIRSIRKYQPTKSFIICLLTSILRISSNIRLHCFRGQFLEVIVLSSEGILGFVVALVFAIPETERVVLTDGGVAGRGQRLPFT